MCHIKKKCRKFLSYFLFSYISIFIYKNYINCASYINNDKYLLLDKYHENIKNQDKNVNNFNSINLNYFSIQTNSQIKKITTIGEVQDEKNTSQQLKSEYTRNSLRIIFPLYIDYWTDFFVVFNGNYFSIQLKNDNSNKNKSLKENSIYFYIKKKINDIIYSGVIIGGNIVSNEETDSEQTNDNIFHNILFAIKNTPNIKNGFQFGLLEVINIEFYFFIFKNKEQDAPKMELPTKEIYHNIFLEFNTAGIPLLSDLAHNGYVNLLNSYNYRNNNLYSYDNIFIILYPKIFFSAFKIIWIENNIKSAPYLSIFFPFNFIKYIFFDIELGYIFKREVSAFENINIGVNLKLTNKQKL